MLIQNVALLEEKSILAPLQMITPSKATVTFLIEVGITSISTLLIIGKVTLTAIEHKPTKTRIDYYVSNEGGTKPTFESVTSGITHTFTTTGNDLCWRAVLNSSINVTSPIIRRVEIDVIPTSIKNVTVALDGVDIFIYIGTLNSTTSPTFVNISPNPNQLNTIKISSVTSGLIMVDNFKVNSSINPIILTNSSFEDCSNCSIDITFGGDDIIVDGLKFDFLGSWNYTASARFGTDEDSSNVSLYYSDFNVSLPKEIEWYDVFPPSQNATNVTPFSQAQSTPIWNITNHAYDEAIDIYVKTNGSLDSCLNVTYTNNTFKIDSTSNESFVWINGTAVQLDNDNLLNGSGVVFNQTDGGTEIKSNNYSIDYADGTITLNSSIFTNTTRINQSITITLTLIGPNSSAMEFISLEAESVRNATDPFYLLTPDVDYRIDENKQNFTLINETFNQTMLFVSYNYSVYTSYTTGQQFGINYSYFVHAYDLNQDFTFRLNTTYNQILKNLSVDFKSPGTTSKGIWNWWDLDGCSAGMEIPYFTFASVCSACVFDRSCAVKCAPLIFKLKKPPSIADFISSTSPLN